MNYKKVYTCDCCHKEFEEPTYLGIQVMGILSYERITANERESTLGVNGEEICLCDKCTEELDKKLREMGFKDLYQGCSSCRL